MGYQFSQEGLDALFETLQEKYDIYAPVIFKEGGMYADTDMIRYAKITHASEIVLQEKSAFSFKEVLLPVMQTLFYFMEKEVKAVEDSSKDAIILLRHCDRKAISRLDAMYLNNGPEDVYYRRIREKIKFM